MNNALAVIALLLPIAGLFANMVIVELAACIIGLCILLYLALKEDYVDGLFFSLLFIVYPLFISISKVTDYFRYPEWDKQLAALDFLRPFYTLAAIITIWRFIAHLENKIKDKDQQIKDLKHRIFLLENNLTKREE